MLLICIILCCAAAFLLRRWRCRRLGNKQPPTLPGAWPIIGHSFVPLLSRNSEELWLYFKEMGYSCLKVGGVATTSIGHIKAYVLTDPEDSLTALNTCLEKEHNFYGLLEPWLGESLLFSPVSMWQTHRKHLFPTVNKRVMLDTFLNTFNHQSERLVEQLAQEVGKGPVDLHHHLAFNIVQSICLTSMGINEDELDSMRKVMNEYLVSLNNVLTYAVDRLLRPYLMLNFIHNYSTNKKNQDKAVEKLLALSSELIKRRRSKLKNNKYEENTKDELDTSKDSIYIDVLLSMAETGIITEKHIQDQVQVLLLGAHDTTAATMLYTIVLLGSHPRVQERLYDEFQNVFGNTNTYVTKTDLSKLTYAEAVLKESMRLYPVLCIYGRKLDRELKLKNYTIPAGGGFGVFVHALNRHPVWGADVEEFRPERWLESASLPDSTSAFASFSWGKRSCLGKAYAMISMKTTLAYLVRRYRFTADHTKLRLVYATLLKCADGHHVIIERRL